MTLNSRLHPVFICTTPALANAAAKSYLITQSDNHELTFGDPSEIIHGKDGAGFYSGVYACPNDVNMIHEFRVAIEMMKLMGGIDSLGGGSMRTEVGKEKKASRMVSRKARSKRAREDSLDEDEDVEQPAKKIAKPKSKSKKG